MYETERLVQPTHCIDNIEPRLIDMALGASSSSRLEGKGLIPQALSSLNPILPQPRSKPLIAGSRKEDALRSYLEGKILHISRRYAKKFVPAEERRSDDVIGYVSMNEVVRDLEELIEIVWVSGTRRKTMIFFIPSSNFHRSLLG